METEKLRKELENCGVLQQDIELVIKTITKMRNKKGQKDIVSVKEGPAIQGMNYVLVVEYNTYPQSEIFF